MEVKKVMEILTSDFDTQLEKTMFEIFESKCNDYETKMDILRGYDNNEFSCVNGCISELTYYYQTKEIFKNNFEEIFELIQDCEIHDIEANYNTMVWFAFGYLTSQWISEIESLLENEEEELNCFGETKREEGLRLQGVYLGF